jgi:hypothetical protein
MPAEKVALVHKISKIAPTVGDLRNLDEKGWAQFGDRIPWMCRVYLRHLVDQSASLTPQQLLECDFNSGLPFELESFGDSLQQLMLLGFQRDEALEALVVNDQNVERAAQYLTLEEDARAVQRENVRKTKARYVPPNRHYTIIEQRTRETEQVETWVSHTIGQLELELKTLKRELSHERTTTEAVAEKVQAKAKENAQLLYTEFLRGVIADPTINANEIQTIDGYRVQRGLDEEDHKRTLKILYLDEDKFEKMKDFETTGGDVDDDCVVCYEPPKDHMLIPCHHVCLCEECADEFAGYGDDAVCPLCDKKIEEIKQVYYS